MSKKIKMCIYGEPGTGKSVFASKAPKPFFITTDGNYSWLEDFGAKPEDHIQVSSWSEAKKAFAMDFSNYDTIVVDLVEDFFKWKELEYCTKNKIDHVSDVGYGKGYDITRNEFFIELSKLIGLDKHIIFISHGLNIVEKDRRGVEHVKHIPSSRIPDKGLDMLEGRLRYFLRCYVKAVENEDKKLVKKRYLSLVPKENEFGIIRGVDENKLPTDIDLDWNIFIETLGLDLKEEPKVVKVKKEEVVKVEKTNDVPKDAKVVDAVEIIEDKNISPSDLEEPKTVEEKEENSNVEEMPQQNPELTPCDETDDEVKQTDEKTMSNLDKIAEIKARLAKLKGDK